MMNLILWHESAEKFSSFDFTKFQGKVKDPFHGVGFQFYNQKPTHSFSKYLYKVEVKDFHGIDDAKIEFDILKKIDTLTRECLLKCLTPEEYDSFTLDGFLFFLPAEHEWEYNTATRPEKMIRLWNHWSFFIITYCDNNTIQEYCDKLVAITGKDGYYCEEYGYSVIFNTHKLHIIKKLHLKGGER